MKIELIQELAFKYLAIKNLITRNKQREQAIQSKSTEKAPTEGGKPSATAEEQKQATQGNLIHFPFIVVASSAVDNNVS